MALTFTAITENNTLQELTTQLNNIGSELTKERNIFQITEDLLTNLNKAQRVKITSDTGIAKTISGVTRLSALTEPGYYYIPYATLKTMSDAPQSTTDVLLLNAPVDNTKTIQQVYFLSTSNFDIKTAYRYTQGSVSSAWQYLQQLPNNKNVSKYGVSVDSITDPGVYYIYGMTGGMPQGITSGFLTVSIDTSDNRILELVDIATNTKYRKTKTTNGAYTPWKSEFTLKDVDRYMINSLKDDGVTTSLGLLIYVADGKTFQQAIIDYIKATGKQTFTFYVQEGVQGAPLFGSSRGFFFCDAVNEDRSMFGVYYSVNNAGAMASGAVTGDIWSPTRLSASARVLWSGAVNFKDLTTKTLNESINNYNYVEIYTKMKTANTTKGSDDTGMICHKFAVETNGTYVCLGNLLSGDTTPSPEIYRVGVKISDTNWNITDSAIANTKTQYVTRIVGYYIR